MRDSCEEVVYVDGMDAWPENERGDVLTLAHRIPSLDPAGVQMEGRRLSVIFSLGDDGQAIEHATA